MSQFSPLNREEYVEQHHFFTVLGECFVRKDGFTKPCKSRSWKTQKIGTKCGSPILAARSRSQTSLANQRCVRLTGTRLKWQP